MSAVTHMDRLAEQAPARDAAGGGPDRPQAGSRGPPGTRPDDGLHLEAVVTHTRRCQYTSRGEIYPEVAAAVRVRVLDPHLADVKYLADADPQTVLERGTYLNRQLLDEGLARRYEG